MDRLARRHLRGKRTEFILDCYNLVGTFVGGFNGLTMLVGYVVFDVKNLGLLTPAGIRTTNIPVESISMDPELTSDVGLLQKLT